MSTLLDSRMLTPADVAKRLATTKKTVRQMEIDGRMPQGTRLGLRMVRWPADVIDNWIAAGCPAVNQELN